VRRALLRVCLLVGVFCIVVAACAFAGIRFNGSESLPGLFYIVTNDATSPLIEFCPESVSSRLSSERGYRRSGVCPDGAAPMLKPIAAQAGDLVEVSPYGIAVNGTTLRNSAPRFRDSRGRPLTHWPFGRYRVPEGFVWVVSQYNALSFDSRYFGPVPIRSIRHHLHPL
jgi:conjugative transfer signal peptidase TraF